MKPPGDADTDGSSSNCAAFFISTVHDLSLHETHAFSSPPPHTRDSLFPASQFLAPLSSISVQMWLCLYFIFFSSPKIFLIEQYSCPPFFFSLCYLCFCPLLFVCMCLLQWIPTPCYFPFLAGSLFSADVPLVSSGLAGRQQKWLWDWGMAAVLSLTHRTTLNSLWPHTCRAERRVRQQESNEMKTWQRATNLFAEIK